MALSITQVVNGLRISRSEFGRIFVQAQMDLVANGQDRQLFEAVTHSGSDQEAFTEALNWAEQKQLLDTMLRAIVAEGLEDGSITAALTAEAIAANQDPGRKAALQAITDLSRGFSRPEVFYRGVNIGMRWTVKIMVDGAFKGYWCSDRTAFGADRLACSSVIVRSGYRSRSPQPLSAEEQWPSSPFSGVRRLVGHSRHGHSRQPTAGSWSEARSGACTMVRGTQ